MISRFITAVRTYLMRGLSYARTHRKTTAGIAAVLLVCGYFAYQHLTSSSTQTTYTVTTVATGTIISTISGSGQISPSSEITINPQASGQITRVLVKDGDNVTANQAIAYIDSSDEYNSVQSAKNSLASAQLSLQKLQQPATQLSVTQAQNAIAKDQESITNAQTSLAKAYTTAYNDVISTFLDLPSVQSHLKNIVIGTDASRGATWNVDYYKSAITTTDSNAGTYRDNAFNTYTASAASYNKAYPDYQLASTQTVATSTIVSLLNETYSTTQDTMTALNAANSFIQLYENDVKNLNQDPVSTAVSSLTTLSSDLSKVNNDLSTLLNDQNAITSAIQSVNSANRSLVEDQQSYDSLMAGATTLDLQSAQLNVTSQEQALQQAEDNLSNYTVRAPIAGTIANLGLTVGQTVGSGTSAATLITDSQIADLSLNEVDAAKVMVGQKATLTFDAISNLSISGTVTSVSPLGSVSQGVVSYDVKISLDTQDARVKAGMTVNADIQTAVHSSVLTVPSSAVHTSNGTSYVLAYQPALSGGSASSTETFTTTQTPTQITVTTGISDNTNTEILTGLTAGEQIVKNSSSASATKSAASTATSRSGRGGGVGGPGLGI